MARSESAEPRDMEGRGPHKLSAEALCSNTAVLKGEMLQMASYGAENQPDASVKDAALRAALAKRFVEPHSALVIVRRAEDSQPGLARAVGVVKESNTGHWKVNVRFLMKRKTEQRLFPADMDQRAFGTRGVRGTRARYAPQARTEDRGTRRRRVPARTGGAGTRRRRVPA